MQIKTTKLVANSIHTVEPGACDATAKADEEVVAEPQTDGGVQTRVGRSRTRWGEKKSKDSCYSNIGSNFLLMFASRVLQKMPCRKPKDSTASSSIPPPAKAVSSRSKVKTPGGCGKHSSMTPRNVAPTQPPDDACSSATQTQTKDEQSTTPVTGRRQRNQVRTMSHFSFVLLWSWYKVASVLFCRFTLLRRVTVCRAARRRRSQPMSPSTF